MNETATIPDYVRCPRCGAYPALQGATELRPGVEYLTLRCPCCAIVYDAQLPSAPENIASQLANYVLLGATPKPSVGLIVMDKERRALVEQAARCRNAANDIDHHPKAAERLRKMAMEYESRAAGLEDQKARLKASRRRRTRAKSVDQGEKAALPR